MDAERLEFYRRFMGRHVRSPLKPELNYRTRKVLAPTNVVAGMDMGKSAGTGLCAKISAFAQIDFTGGVFRYTLLPDEQERLLHPNHPSNRRRDHTALVFPSSALRMSGATSVVCALAAMHIMRWIQYMLGYPCDFSKFRVDNIATSGNFGHPLSLADLQCQHDETGIAWKPEKFPGAFYYNKEEDVVVLMFDTGEKVAVGLRNVKQVAPLDAHMNKLMAPFVASDNSQQHNLATHRCVMQQVAVAQKRQKRQKNSMQDMYTVGRRLHDNINQMGSVNTAQDLDKAFQSTDVVSKPNVIAAHKRSFDSTADQPGKRVLHTELEEIAEWERL